MRSARRCCQIAIAIATRVRPKSIVASTFTSTGMPRCDAPKLAAHEAEFTRLKATR